MSELLTTETIFAPVQHLLPLVEEKMRVQADDYHPELVAALAHLLASGGKRVRPVVVLLAGGMLSGDTPRLVTLAAAIELLHTATLVHDDLIDGALLRRGIATLNAQWSPAATVLTGDFIFARAAKLAAETDSVPVVRRFSETLATIVNGELRQLFNSRGQASRPDYDQRIYAKTASMFELAGSAAALLSPASPAVVEQLRRYGHAVGMAFQIVDDILDFTGEQATVGKPVASDLRQGLVTLPALLYLDAHPDDPDMQVVLSGNYSAAALDRLVSAIRTGGAIQQAMDVAVQYVEQGVAALEDLPAGPHRQALIDLAYYIVRRNS